MDFFSMLPFGHHKPRKSKKAKKQPNHSLTQDWKASQPALEPLEDRFLPSVTPLTNPATTLTDTGSSTLTGSATTPSSGGAATGNSTTSNIGTAATSGNVSTTSSTPTTTNNNVTITDDFSTSTTATTAVGPSLYISPITSGPTANSTGNATTASNPGATSPTATSNSAATTTATATSAQATAATPTVISTQTTTGSPGATSVPLAATNTSTTTGSPTPSGNSSLISGYVYNDLNNNGVIEQGEPPIANSHVELLNSTGQVIGNATTDNNGYYQFANDSSVNTNVQTETQTIEIPDTVAGFSITKALKQFDPSLGDLQEVDVTNQGAITSAIRAENTSTLVGATITGKVSGTLGLTGPNNVAVNNTVNQNAGSFQATPFDGVIDFGGNSGVSLPPVTATADPQGVALTGQDMAPFVGTGQVNFTENVNVASSATGGGNLLAGITSTANAKVTVVYKYRPHNSIQPGTYVVVQTPQPNIPGTTTPYLYGLLTGNGTVIPGSVGSDSIKVAFTGSSSTHNDFAKLVPGSLSGFVYYDANGNGRLDSADSGIGSNTVTLTGVDDNGNNISQTTTTAADGSYHFNGLRPGQYILQDAPPAGYNDGQDNLGSLGGTVGHEVITSIPLQQGQNGTDYDFGYVHSSALSGYVYLDKNGSGVKDAGNPGLAGGTLTLTGTTTTGVAVNQTTTSAADGSYSFGNVLPGTYTIQESGPAGYADAKENVGTLGGTLGTDQIASITVGPNVNGTNYNFGKQLTGDVGIVKSVTPTNALAGGTVNYTLTVTNFGPSTAQNVKVDDPLPAGMTYVNSQAPAGWTTNVNGNDLVFTDPSLVTGGVATINVTAKAPVPAGTYQNTAVVSSTTPDSNPNNNRSTATVTVPSAPISPDIQPPANPPGEVLTKAVLLASGDFWTRLLS